MDPHLSLFDRLENFTYSCMQTPINLYNISEDDSFQNIKTIRQHLVDWEVESESMQKAKDYWLDHTSYNTNKLGQESLKEQVKTEAELIRVRLCKWKTRIFKEEVLNMSYHQQARANLPQELTCFHLLSELPNINAAGVDIFSKIDIPDNFVSWSDYCRDHTYEREQESIIRSIKVTFTDPFEDETEEGLLEAVRLWTELLSEDEIDRIRAQYPIESERIRTQLWKRQLTFNNFDTLTDMACVEIRQKQKTETLYNVCQVAAITSCVVAVVFFCLSFVNPFFLIGAGISLILALTLWSIDDFKNKPEQVSNKGFSCKLTIH